MANFFDVDFDQQVQDILSPDKRLPKNVAILQALMKSIQWCRDLVLGSYKSGSTVPVYSAGTYNIYDQVIFNKAVYSSLISNNTNDPTVSSSWALIQKDFIGVDERIKFNGEKIVLEYALNKRFGGVFRPPITLSNSDIYIENLPAVVYGFRIGQTEDFSSSVGQTTSSDYVGSPYPFIRINNFQINFLNSLYIQTNEKEIRNFVNKYIAAGLNYTIVSY